MPLLIFDLWDSNAPEEAHGMVIRRNLKLRADYTKLIFLEEARRILNRDGEFYSNEQITKVIEYLSNLSSVTLEHTIIRKR